MRYTNTKLFCLSTNAPQVYCSPRMNLIGKWDMNQNTEWQSSSTHMIIFTMGGYFRLCSEAVLIKFLSRNLMCACCNSTCILFILHTYQSNRNLRTFSRKHKNKILAFKLWPHTIILAWLKLCTLIKTDKTIFPFSPVSKILQRFCTSFRTASALFMKDLETGMANHDIYLTLWVVPSKELVHLGGVWISFSPEASSRPKVQPAMPSGSVVGSFAWRLYQEPSALPVYNKSERGWWVQGHSCSLQMSAPTHYWKLLTPLWPTGLTPA